MKFTISIFTLLFSFTFIHSQDYSLEFGEVNINDFNFEYAKGPDAEATVLYDIGESGFQRTDNGYDLVFTRRTKIKIVSNPAIEKFSEIEIPIYYDKSGVEKVDEVEAITYNLENGLIKKTQLEKSDLYEEIINENWRVKKFTMPNVKAGSVIEYKYTIISPYKFNLQDWKFQNTIPTVYSKYTAKMIPFYEYVFLLQGASRFDEQKSYASKGMERQFGSVTFHDNIHEYVMKDVPAFKDVDHITSIEDYIIKMDFQLSVVHQTNGADIEYMTTWPDLVEELAKGREFGDFVDKSRKYASKVDNLSDVRGKNDLEKLEIGVNYVKTNFTWDGMYGKYAAKNLKEFTTEKTGNSGCINLFLTGVLRQLGLEAYPLILSTRKHGKISTTYPFSKFFNYVVVAVEVDGNLILTDATEYLTPFYRIPIRCINDKGLLINENDMKWIDLYPNFLSRTKREFNITLNEALDSGYVHFSAASYEYDALNHRKKYNKDKDDVKNFIKSDDMQIEGKANYLNETSAEKPFIFSFIGTQPIERYNDKIYLSPFLNEAIQENPFKVKERNYPVDFIYPFSKKFKSTINIPFGYKIQEIPEAFDYDNDLAEIQYLVTETGKDKVVVEGWYTFKKSIYEPKDYSKLKYLYMEIIKNFNQKIVLTKM